MPNTDLDGIMLELGLPALKRSASPLALSNLIQRGLPLKALDVITAKLVRKGTRDKWLLISAAQYRRLRAKPSAKLSPALSARVARAAQLWIITKATFGNEEGARQFLFTDQFLLKGQRPIDIAISNEFGARVVAEILDLLA